MSSEIGSEQIAFVPTFKGFRSATDKEVDGTTRAVGNTFKTGFGRAAAATGTSAGKSFKDSFASSSAGLVSSATAEIAKASRELSAARAKELDVTGRVRLAEAQLAEARVKYADGSSQVVRAEERAATAARQLVSAQSSVQSSTERLATAKRSLASASSEAATTSSGLGSVLSRLPTFFGTAGTQSAKSFGSGFSGGIGSIAAGSFLGLSVAGLANGFGRLVGTAINASVDSVQGASNLAETTSAIGQVYGDASGDILSFSKSANTALGQTRLQALKGAQTFGVFAKQAGLTGKPLASFSTGLVGLAGDLASFYNSSPDDAIEAIGAGLRGEAEPLRRFGVLLDDATLKQKALELGIYDGTDALTGQQRILAAQAVILDQTGIAQGDFARTSDGLANQQRILAASLEDTKTKFGEALLPAFQGATSFANDTLIPKLSELVDVVGPKLSQALIDNGPEFEKLWAKAEPLIDGFAGAVTDEGIPGFISLMNQVVDAAPGWAEAIKTVTDPAGTAGLDSLTSTGGGVDTFFKPARAAFEDFFFGSGRAERIAGTDQFFGDMTAFFQGYGSEVEWKSALIKEQWKTSITDTVRDLNAFGKDWVGLGEHYGDGLAEGFRNRTSTVSVAAAELAGEALTASRDKLNVKSPSKEAEKIGQYFGDGLGIGMSNREGFVASSAASLASAAISSSSAALTGGPALAASASSGAAFPDQVQLVDASGAFLAMLDVRIQRYDSTQRSSRAQGSRGD